MTAHPAHRRPDDAKVLHALAQPLLIVDAQGLVIDVNAAADVGDAEIVGVEIRQFGRDVRRRQPAILEMAPVERAQASPLRSACAGGAIPSSSSTRKSINASKANAARSRIFY